MPGEYSSGETQRRGAITKAGHSRTRWLLLIHGAVSILRRRPPQAEELRTWAMRLAARRGKQVAVVALARRLAGSSMRCCEMAACSSPSAFGILLVPLLRPPPLWPPPLWACDSPAPVPLVTDGIIGQPGTKVLLGGQDLKHGR